jgi:hypothetical protein
MADPTQTPFGFRIRRVDEPASPAARPAPAPTPQPTPEPPTQSASPESPADAPTTAPSRSEQPRGTPAATGARFPTPGRVLAFIGAVAGSGLVQEVLCRRGPEGGWWVETDQPTRDLVHLIWTTGGRPYARPAGTQSAGSGAWQQLDLDGVPTGPTLDADAWPQVELPQLLAGTGLRPCIPVSANTLYLAVPAALSRWALKRALALGLEVGIRSARARPLGEAGRDQGGADDAGSSLLILRLCAGRREVPRSLARALAALPYATLAQSIGAAEGRLLVDVAYRAPLADSLLGDLVPPGATWLLAGPETGHRSLTMDGEELDAASLLEAPALVPGAADLTAEGGGALPTPLPVQLVPVTGRHDPIDALLLDDTELDWTRRVLMGRPLAERAFLLPGAGRHLLLVGAAGGLAADLPFGTPLTAAGPGGLFLETGLCFRPALPDGARRKALGLDPERVLVLTAEGAWRFELDHLVPAWTLWVGAAPAVQEGLTGRGPALLAALDREQRGREAARESAARRLLEALRGRLVGPRPGQEADPETLRAEAIRAQQAGDLVRAAELRAAVGDLGDAGRLYEQAAGRAG